MDFLVALITFSIDFLVALNTKHEFSCCSKYHSMSFLVALNTISMGFLVALNQGLSKYQKVSSTPVTKVIKIIVVFCDLLGVYTNRMLSQNFRINEKKLARRRTYLVYKGKSWILQWGET